MLFADFWAGLGHNQRLLGQKEMEVSMRFAFWPFTVTLMTSLLIYSCGRGGPTPDGGLKNASFFGNWNGRIYDPATGTEVAQGDFALSLSGAKTIVLGEKHYTQAVQQKEADIMRDVVLKAGRVGSFSLGWEFLELSSRGKIKELYEQFERGDITAQDFLKSTQGTENAYAYEPVLEATKALQGDLWATNLSHEEKRPIVQGGLAAADPSIVPPGFKMGSANYYERFKEEMGHGHATPDMVSHYFDAQCLTDDVMAYWLLEQAKPDLRFLVVGSFHVDYGDGVVARLRDRAPSEKLLNVRIIDASDYRPDELLPMLRDPKYGPLADYAVFVNEPTN